MGNEDLCVGDEIISNDSQTGKCYIIVHSRPEDKWVICISKDDGWHYAFRKTEVHKTGKHFIFSDKLTDELERAMAYRYHISKRLLTDEHIIPA